jgi:hypothetical protein
MYYRSPRGITFSCRGKSNQKRVLIYYSDNSLKAAAQMHSSLLL